MLKNELKQQIIKDAQRALAEDLGKGDITAALIEDKEVTARLICREKAILCGVAWFEECFRQLMATTQTATRFDWCMTDGATATAAYKWRQLVNDAVVIVDTRKTLPLLRWAQKYAVRVGGAENHRMGLYDEMLIKENHISGGGIAAVLQAAFARMDKKQVQIEVRTMDELEQAIVADARRILLDNFSIAMLKKATAMVAKCGTADIELEASGNINENNIAAVAATGVARVSVGAITKNIQAVDFSLLFD